MKGREHYEKVVDRVMQSLQQPCADLRGTGIDSWHAHTVTSVMSLTSKKTSKFTYFVSNNTFLNQHLILYNLKTFLILNYLLGLAVKCLGLLALTSEEKCKGM